jgi:hypothetical protein
MDHREGQNGSVSDGFFRQLNAHDPPPVPTSPNHRGVQQACGDWETMSRKEKKQSLVRTHLYNHLYLFHHTEFRETDARTDGLRHGTELIS